jgi:tRNA(Ile)-lysidine synthase
MPTPDQVQRFRAAFPSGAAPARLGLAVSGGPDSLALLMLADAAFPGAIEAATVDHRLRAGNAEEARAVAAVCETLGVPHAILSDPAAPIAGASPQAQARALRYRLLAAWAGERGIPCVATGHHADDQAETLLMRLARGAGVAGLAGIRARREAEGVTILRPLLGWRRAELARIVEEAGLAAADDPSNSSDAYDRTRFRRLLAGTDLLPAGRLAAAAAHLADAEQALAWAAGREWAARVREEDGALLLDPAGLPPELCRRLVVRAVSAVRGGGAWRDEKVTAALLEALERGGRANIAGVSIAGGSLWRFAPEPPRRSV